MSAAAEASAAFDCFGGRCEVHVTGHGPLGSAQEAVQACRRAMLGWHAQFSRFTTDSELAKLNADTRRQVPVSAVMARFAAGVPPAAELSGGLVDGTLLSQIERAGYRGELPRPLELRRALQLAPVRAPAAAAAQERWRELTVDLRRSVVERPPGLRLDSGGLAKGMFADILGESLAEHASFAVNCAGDLAIGGAAGLARAIEVQGPFDGLTLHTFRLRRTGVATSGIGRRSWLGEDGLPAHHLLDPATGRPAFTGVVQATALAPTALEAEVRAKAAVLSGPVRAGRWLAHGGVIVLDDGGRRLIEPPPTVSLSDLSAYADRRQSTAAEDG